MNRKLLFLLFAESHCKQNHAFMYAIDLAKNGHEVKLVIEGKATLCLRRLKGDARFVELFKEACTMGLLVGACRKASGGCVSEEDSVQDIAKQYNLKMLDELMGHASITSFVNEGYEVVTF